MARALYTLLILCALPFTPLRLWWRGRREAGYRQRIGERFGWYGRQTPQPRGEVIWIHAVSLGETRAAAPLIDRIERERPGASILLTHMTATGRDAGRALFGDCVVQAWLPYDVPFAVRAFLRRFAPAAGLLMETEVWPNLVAGCAAAQVPLFLVNARLSARSARGYARWPALTRPMFAALTAVAAQTETDAQRLRDVGAVEVTATGNLKFDQTAPSGAMALAQEFRNARGAERPCLVAASMRDGEEALLLDALARQPLPDNALTVIVPRHPQRFDDVAALLTTRRIPFVRRSDHAPVPPAVRVLLGDSMGEMAAYYLAADVAFIGGSLLPLGGQNLLEAIALGVPTLVGPHMFNFADATSQAIAAGAAIEVADADALLRHAAGLLQDEAARQRMQSAAQTFLDMHRGATERLWQWLAAVLPPPQISRSDGG